MGVLDCVSRVLLVAAVEHLVGTWLALVEQAPPRASRRHHQHREYTRVAASIEVSGSLPAAADTALDAWVGESTPDMSACMVLESSDKVEEAADVPFCRCVATN